MVALCRALGADRMLIAQAQAEDLWLVSNEELFDEAGVRRLW